jgi:hypothetical protein
VSQKIIASKWTVKNLYSTSRIYLSQDRHQDCAIKHIDLAMHNPHPENLKENPLYSVMRVLLKTSLGPAGLLCSTPWVPIFSLLYAAA